VKRAIVLLAMLIAAVEGASQTLPKLISSELPQYPSHARAARIQGTVKLWFEINSRGKIVRADTTSGHPLLRQAAIRNVKTWRFQVPDARSGRYETEFDYRLLEESSETPRVSVSMSGLTRVEVASELQAITDTGWHEPDLDLSKPLKVYLARCEVDGEVIPCEQVSVELIYKNKEITPKKFRLGELQGFIVPKKLRKIRKEEAFGVAVTTPNGRFVLPKFYAAYLKGSWEIVLAHEPFPKKWKYHFDGRQPCMGLIHIPWTEPKLIFYHACSSEGVASQSSSGTPAR
jgi:TonB family protein